MTSFWKAIAFAALIALGGGPAYAMTLISDQNDTDANMQLTCGGARDLLVNHGYRNVTVRSCFTFAYAFTVDLDGRPVRVFVDPQNGRAWIG